MIEKKIEELETLIDKMDDETSGLETSIKHYSEALKKAKSILNALDKKEQQLLKIEEENQEILVEKHPVSKEACQ